MKTAKVLKKSLNIICHNMNATHLESIGGMIRVIRTAKGWTQAQLAEEAGLRTATVSDIEKGKLNFEINTLARIATALGFRLDIQLLPTSK